MKYLVIGPCAQGVFAILGYLKRHESELATIEAISGASAGAMIAFLMITGKTIDQLLDMFLSIDTSQMSKMNLKLFFKSYGFSDPMYIREKLVEVWGGDPLFRDLPPRPKLYVSAFCIDTGQTEYFSVDTHPNMHVAEAVTMSSIIPIMFSSWTFQGRLYLDGGVIEKFPAVPFLHMMRRDVLALTIDNVHRPGAIKNFKDFIVSIIRSCIRNARISYNVPEINIDAQDFTLADMNMSHDDKLKLFLIGYQQHGPVWSQDKHSHNASCGNDETSHGSKQCGKTEQGSAVRGAVQVLGVEPPTAPDE